MVPIPYDAPAASTVALLKQINGALFTGGAASFFSSTTGQPTIFAETASLVFQESVAAAAAGEAWP